MSHNYTRHKCEPVLKVAHTNHKSHTVRRTYHIIDQWQHLKNLEFFFEIFTNLLASDKISNLDDALP